MSFRAVLLVSLVLCLRSLTSAQSPPPDPEQTPQPETQDQQQPQQPDQQQNNTAPTPGSANPNAMTSVQGIVRVGTSGEPLPHALVRINGDASTGVLTDGDGRFTIENVAQGPQIFQITKPGYLDRDANGMNASSENPRSFGHNIIVAPQMPDIIFTMERVNSIQGQVQLSTGDAAQGIQLTLLRRTVQDGRVVWQTNAAARTNIDGMYRFGELPDGMYAVYTQPTMDSDTAASLVESGSGGKVEREGYASTFYPDAHDLAGAATISLSGGEQAQANINLTLEHFHSVTATPVLPRRTAGDESIGVQVTDAQFHSLPYPAQYDAATHTVQAQLPDGAYTFLAGLQYNPSHLEVMSNDSTNDIKLVSLSSRTVRGEVGFAVAGRAVSRLQIPMSELASAPVQVILSRSPNSNTQTGNPSIHVTLTQAGGWLDDGMVAIFAEGSGLTPMQTQHPLPGQFWLHTVIDSKTVCENSFTAGGASLAREPLTLTSAGTTPPLVLSLRDDCASLTLSLPAAVGLGTGEEPYYTVYLVPDFDSTTDVIPQTLRPSTGGRIKLAGLTPGSYHIYAFSKPVALAYRDPAALSSLQGQAVTLAPGADAEVEIQVAQP